MTKQRRGTWRKAHRDITAADHGEMVRRRTVSIPTGVDPAERLAAVKAAAAKQKHPKKGKMPLMHDAVKKELVARLARLTSDERAELFSEAAAENIQTDGMTRTAEAVRDLVGHAQPKKGPEND